MSQKIEYIKIKDFKGIKEVEVNNLSRFVAIFGKNGAGKTSFIEAIKSAIKAEKGVNSKVRVGEEKGEIIVEFEDFKITRIIGDNGKLIVEHNGELVNKPQSWLDNIFLGTIGDPQKFINLKDKEKIKYILETHGKKIEFDILEKDRVAEYDRRTDIHRTYLAKKEEVERFELEKIEIPENNMNLDILQKELEEIEQYNSSFYEIKDRLNKGEQIISGISNEIESIKSQINYSKNKIADYKTMIELEEKKIGENNILLSEKEVNLKKSENLKDDLQNEISDFIPKNKDEVMQKIKDFQEKQQIISDITAKKNLVESQKTQMNNLKDEWTELDKKVKEIELSQNNLIKDLNLTYDFEIQNGEMFVKIDGKLIPLDELNTALQLEIGVDICLNGPNKIKIITIENANALDPNCLERIKEKIEKHEAQCFLETVYNTGYESIVIQDGMN